MPETNIVALPEVINFTRLKGDTFEYTYIFTDSLGAPYNLNVLTKITMQIRKKPGAVDILWVADLVAGLVIQGVGNNEVKIEKIIDINGGDYYHDLQFEYSNGKIFTPVGGAFKVVTDVTVTT